MVLAVVLTVVWKVAVELLAAAGGSTLKTRNAKFPYQTITVIIISNFF